MPRQRCTGAARGRVTPGRFSGRMAAAPFEKDCGERAQDVLGGGKAPGGRETLRRRNQRGQEIKNVPEPRNTGDRAGPSRRPRGRLCPAVPRLAEGACETGGHKDRVRGGGEEIQKPGEDPGCSSGPLGERSSREEEEEEKIAKQIKGKEKQKKETQELQSGVQQPETSLSSESLLPPLKKKALKTPGAVFRMLETHATERLAQDATLEESESFNSSLSMKGKFHAFYLLCLKSRDSKELFLLSRSLDLLRQGQWSSLRMLWLGRRDSVQTRVLNSKIPGSFGRGRRHKRPSSCLPGGTETQPTGSQSRQKGEVGPSADKLVHQLELQHSSERKVEGDKRKGQERKRKWKRRKTAVGKLGGRQGEGIPRKEREKWALGGALEVALERGAASGTWHGFREYSTDLFGRWCACTGRPWNRGWNALRRGAPQRTLRHLEGMPVRLSLGKLAALPAEPPWNACQAGKSQRLGWNWDTSGVGPVKSFFPWLLVLSPHDSLGSLGVPASGSLAS